MSPYTKNFTQTYSLPISLRRKRIFSLVIFKKPLVFNIVLISLILFFIIFQLILVNKMAIYSFKTKELEEKKIKLKQETKNLELEKIRIESLESIQAGLKNLNLVKTENLEYLKSVSGAVATK